MFLLKKTKKKVSFTTKLITFKLTQYSEELTKKSFKVILQNLLILSYFSIQEVQSIIKDKKKY